MKFYTPQLWKDWNSDDDSTRRTAIKQADMNAVAYKRQLDDLRIRLGETNYHFFLEEELHDGRLMAFTVGDAIDFDFYGGEKYDINEHNTSVRIRLIGPYMNILYTLDYSEVRRVVFDYMTDEPLFAVLGDHIGDWGYHEISAPDDDYFEHEILFASGTSVRIEFKKFQFQKAERSELKGRYK
jgi:hypothetical protein